MKTQKYSPTLPLTLVLDGGGKATPCPGHFTTEKKTRYPFYRRLNGPRDQPGQVQKILLPPGWNLVLSRLCYLSCQ